jgi:hydroxyacylglutathione hydrolase
MTTWFRINEVSGGVFAISDHGWDKAYLVVGSKKALLVDTTWGMGDLAGAVRAITRLPLTVVLTHGHSDHVSGSHQFAQVHIARDDMRLLRQSFRRATRRRFAASFAHVLQKQGFSPAEWGEASLGTVTAVRDGDAFELGGRRLEVVACPGHTRGCISLFDARAGCLFTGDSLLEGDILVHLIDDALETYVESLERLGRLPGVRRLLPGHARTPISPKLIGVLANGVREILSGKRKGAPWQDGVRRAKLGKAAVTFRPLDR